MKDGNIVSTRCGTNLCLFVNVPVHKQVPFQNIYQNIAHNLVIIKFSVAR